MRFPSSARAPRLRRPSPALAVAFVALLAGGMTQASWAVNAAGKIMGADVVDSSLTGKDVKDGSLGPSDLSRAARAALSGIVGPPGPKGETGSAGPAGQPGMTGPQGPTGAAGPTGDTGPPGAKGDTGPSGSAGQTGTLGQAGAAGPKGDQGLVGPAGAKGAPGPQGEPGRPAADLWAAVKSSGDIVASSSPAPAVAAMSSGTGRIYKLTFARSIRDCAVTVSRQSQLVDDPDAAYTLPGGLDQQLGGTAYTFFGEYPPQLLVRLIDPDGAGTKGDFSVTLQCEQEATVGLLSTR